MHELICTDETFDPNFTIEYKLSIQVSLDGFSFCILDDIRKKYLVFKHFPFRLSNASFLARKTKEILENEEILSLNYKEVKILIESPHFAVVPNIPEFEQSPEIYLRQNFTLPSNSEFHTFKNDFFNCFIVYSYSKQLKSVFKEKFSSYTLLQSIEPTFNKITTNGFKNDITCIINVTSQYYSVLIFEDKRLLFLNTFNYKNEQDFLYFLMSTIKTLEIKSEELKVLISGDIEIKSTLHELLLKHVENINFMKFNSSFQYSYTFEKIQQHQFINIINPEG